MIDVQVNSDRDEMNVGFSSRGGGRASISTFVYLSRADALRLVRGIMAALDFERDLAKTKGKQRTRLINRFFAKRNQRKLNFVAGGRAK